MSESGQPWVEGEDYYVDDNGLFVLTAKYLRRRGYCCHQGCRHCPYGEENAADETAPEETPD